MTNSPDPGSSGFPSLPIITPPRRSEPAREVWHSVLRRYHRSGRAGGPCWLVRLPDVVDGRRLVQHLRLERCSEPEEMRVQAAFALSRDPRVEQNQLWDLCLNRKLPELARYTLAEAIGPELVAQDPQRYASAVTLSPDWPSWLRLVLVRPLAYAATRGHALSRDRLGDCAGAHP